MILRYRTIAVYQLLVLGYFIVGLAQRILQWPTSFEYIGLGTFLVVLYLFSFLYTLGYYVREMINLLKYSLFDFRAFFSKSRLINTKRIFIIVHLFGFSLSLSLGIIKALTQDWTTDYSTYYDFIFFYLYPFILVLPLFVVFIFYILTVLYWVIGKLFRSNYSLRQFVALSFIIAPLLFVFRILSSLTNLFSTVGVYIIEFAFVLYFLAAVYVGIRYIFKWKRSKAVLFTLLPLTFLFLVLILFLMGVRNLQ